MKSNSKIISAVLFLAGVSLTGWWLLQPAVRHETPQKEQIISETKPSKVTAPNLPKEELPDIPQPFARTKYLRLKDPRWAIYERETKLDPNYEWKTPIEFYGKVVDENNQPVPDALVSVEWVGADERDGPGGVGHRTQKSGPDGLFSITGLKGKCLGARVSKEGYFTKGHDNSFEYGGFWEPTFIEPDKNNPIVYHLLKRPVAELTYSIGGTYKILPPVLEAYFDMLKLPTLSSVPADLFVRITRSPTLPANHKDEVWMLEIEGRGDSEIILTNDEYMIKAPSEGYKPKIVNEYRGVSNQRITCYVRSKQRGYYASVFFNVTPWRPYRNIDCAEIIFNAVVNPNNSPIVDYDKAKDIRKIEEENSRRRR